MPSGGVHPHHSRGKPLLTHQVIVPLIASPPPAPASPSSAASTVAPTPRASGCPMPRWPPLIFSPPHFTATGTTPSGHDSPQTDAVVRAQALSYGKAVVWSVIW